MIGIVGKQIDDLRPEAIRVFNSVGSPTIRREPIVGLSQPRFLHRGDSDPTDFEPTFLIPIAGAKVRPLLRKLPTKAPRMVPL